MTGIGSLICRCRRQRPEVWSGSPRTATREEILTERILTLRFWAIHRALTKAAIAELRSVSTRAAITSASFTNHYEWGDLKAYPFNSWKSTSTRFFTLQTGERVNCISSFRREDKDWDNGTGWMGSLMSLRSDLLRGDLRCLYLGWLLCAQNGEFAENELEPAVPAGFGELSAPLHSLIEFLE